MSERSTAAAPIPISGWVEAGLYTCSIAVLGVIYAIGHQIGVHPIAFILYAMVVSALLLLVVTGPGPEAIRIILAPQSWLVGIVTVGLEICYYLTLTHLTPTNASLLVRIAIPMAMLAGWLLFARRPPGLAMIGSGIVVIGLVPLALAVPGEHRVAVFWAVMSAAVTFVLRSFSSEFHSWNRRAETVMDKLRVTGLVVLVTCIAGLALAAIGIAAVAFGFCRRCASFRPVRRCCTFRRSCSAPCSAASRSPRSWCSVSPPWSRFVPRISWPSAPSLR